MHQTVTVLRTKIVPPRGSPRTLARARITATLAEALKYRLTLVQAGAGCGKTTALASLSGLGHPLIWYQVMEEDSDPLVFLLHLCHAARLALPDLPDLPISLLESWDGTSIPLPSTQIIDRFINSLSAGLDAPTLFVLDDAHHAAGSPEIAHLLDRLVGLGPDNLHILLASRQPISLPNLSRWRSQGLVFNVDRSALAFDSAEIGDLFCQAYAYDLSPDEAELLFNATEGWAIALQLVWQSLRSGAFTSVEEVLSNQAASLDSLFHLLASETFEVQPADVQEFLRVTAVLRRMTPEACRALLSPGQPLTSVSAMLAYLRRLDLFVVDLGDGSLRYHHIFHSFLQQLSRPDELRAWHLLAAGAARDTGEFDEAIYHFYGAGDLEGAAALLDGYGAHLLSAGRLENLANALDGLQPETLKAHPTLLVYLGELARLRSRYPEALGWYRQAEAGFRERGQVEGVSRALRGQARVYLDTVNPSQAEELLEKSIRLTDGIEDQEMRARLYELLAENKLNAGQIQEAERLRRQAGALRSEGPTDHQLFLRVLLRTGRLVEALQKLEALAEAEARQPVLTPRAHRETQLLLSLVYSLLGRGRQAYQAALEGTQRGSALQSPFTTAVGHIRQGHALLLPGSLPNQAEKECWEMARQNYCTAIELGSSLAVRRLQVEALWGLCRANGYSGDLSAALQHAQDGLEIASAAGDEWIASLLRTTMGASLALSGRYEQALDWLSRAAQGFRECSDTFGASAAGIWLCLVRLRQGKVDLLADLLPATLQACSENGYDDLFTGPTLLGPPDERLFVPLLILARSRGHQRDYAGRLLGALGLAETLHHPGYRLYVNTLGGFATRRGSQPVPANSWRRAKARQLFQVLITARSAPLDRDQLLEYLWPGMDPTSAGRNFKVTLNALYNVLEPERGPGAESAYILREGSTYCLRPGADLWLDAEAFTRLVAQAEGLLAGEGEKNAADHEAIALLERALALYQGDYLPDALYETWAAAERERLAVQFLRAADRLCDLYLAAGRSEQAIELCYRILAADNCWEKAYRGLMQAYHALGNRGQVARTYQRCLGALRSELDVAPAPETTDLYARLTHD